VEVYILNIQLSLTSSPCEYQNILMRCRVTITKKNILMRNFYLCSIYQRSGQQILFLILKYIISSHYF